MKTIRLSISSFQYVCCVRDRDRLLVDCTPVNTNIFTTMYDWSIRWTYVIIFNFIIKFFSSFSACINGSCPSGTTCQGGTNCCNTTTTIDYYYEDCTDTGTGCPLLAYLCTNTVYKSLLQQQCPYTCGKCNSKNMVLMTLSIQTSF